MSLPKGLTDDQMYVIYYTHFANIDVRRDKLIDAAKNDNPDLALSIWQDWQVAKRNFRKAREKLFLNQSAAVDQLIKDFISADKQMATALKNLQEPSQTIGKISNVIAKAVAAGTTLIDEAADKNSP